MNTQCPHCGKYLVTEGVEEGRLNSLYRTNTVARWAKEQLGILSGMAEGHDLPEWFVRQVKLIGDEIVVTV